VNWLVAKNIKFTDFRDEAIPYFEFLNGSGFLGPEVGGSWLFWSSGRLGVELFYDGRDGTVTTTLRGPGGNPQAPLHCLYTTAKLGPAQDIKRTARSTKILGKVLESHVKALQRVLPIVDGEDGPRLLRACHGRG
jgi:hypothetical protein